MRVANDVRDTGEGGKVLWGALGVAAGDDDARGGIARVDFADGVAGLGIGGRGDGAGVDDDVVGRVGRLDGRAAAIEELAFDGGAVGLGGAAAELLEVEGRHLRGPIQRELNLPQREGQPGESTRAR